MGDTEIACCAPQSFTLGPSSDLRPALPRDAWSFGHRRIPSDSGSLRRAQEALRVQERDQGQVNHVYLA